MRPRPLVVLTVALALVVAAGAAGAAVVGPAPILARGGFSAADERLVTGLLVTGRAESPILYVTSSDPRIGSGLSEEDLPLDTNSGVISRLRRVDGRWQREDLVRGLPRSEENHATNGLALDERRNRLLVAQGGMTNMGGTSARFAYTPEYALSGSILAVDLGRLEAPYDLPTLGGSGPFGGDGGRNQAVLEPGSPVSLFATGLRNPYDLVLTREGRLYTVDNGPAYFWGGPPSRRGGRCVEGPSEPGSYGADFLYLLAEGDYAGHPNPARANGWVELDGERHPIGLSARPGECAYERGEKALAAFGSSTNGLAEYTAGAFGGAMAGDLLTASIDQRVYRIRLSPDGRAARVAPFAKLPGFPLDVTAQPDGAPFPGTVWVADYLTGSLHVFEPADRARAPHWRQLAPSRVERQEVAYVRLGDRFYLAGGSTEHEAYDPATDTWSSVSPLPVRLDHIQGVALGGRIYYVGGLESFPEPESGTVLVYDPESDSFSRGAPMPRPRGAGGIAVHDGRIYYAGGLHEGRAVPWFDVYDPRTDTWEELPDMPRARDHFQAQVVDGRFYAIGGRDTDVDAILHENDAYDFAAGRWVEGLAPMPTPRAGYASAVVDGEIVTIGGEAPDRTFSEVEAYDPRTDRWRALEPMDVPRHGIQAVACGGEIFVAAGGTRPYGEAPSAVHSVLTPGDGRGCATPEARPPQRNRVAFAEAVVEAGLEHPTSIQFGPDGRLYASLQSGEIVALTLFRTPEGEYRIGAEERIDEIREIPNHDDDGAPAARWGRLVRHVAAAAGICCESPYNRPPEMPRVAEHPPDAERGRAVFLRAGCGGCHTFAPAGTVAFSGPPLDHVTALPPDRVREAIVDPDATLVPGYYAGRMPNDYGRSLSEQQLVDLIAFLVRKRDGAG